MFCVSLPGFTLLCGLKFIGICLQTLQEKDIILLLENNTRGGISLIMGYHYVKSDEKKNISYIDGNIFLAWAMSDSLPHDEIKFDKNVNLEDV